MKTNAIKNAPIKKLSLEKETIRSLTAEQLEGAAGGTTPATIAVSILTAGLTGVAIAYSVAKM